MNEASRLHRLYILFPLVNSVKSLVPLAAFVSIKFFNGKSLDDVPWYWLSAGIVILGALLLLYGYLRWKRFAYTLEEDKILIRRGVLFREELSIYAGRIHSMNTEQPLLQRLLGLTQIRIETPGKSEDGGVLPAVMDREAERLQLWLRDRTRALRPDRPAAHIQDSAAHADGGIVNADESVPMIEGTPPYERTGERDAAEASGNTQEAGINGGFPYGRGNVIPPLSVSPEERSILLQLPSRRLLTAALSSPNLSLALAFVGGIVSFADDLLPDQIYQSLFQSAGRILPGHWAGIAILAVVLAWLLSVILYMIKYAGFTVERIGKQISVSYGLLEKKRLLFSPERVLAATVKEGIFRRWFGYAEVKLHVLTSESEKHFMLHPLIKTTDIPELLARVTPQLSVQAITASPPPHAKWMYLRWKLAIAAAASIGCIWYFGWPGTFSLLLFPLAVGWGLAAHRDSGLNITGKQLTIRSRFLALSTKYIRRPQIIAIEVTGTRRQRRRGLLSLQVKMILSDINESLVGMDEREIMAVWAWFQNNKGGRSAS